MGLGAMTSCWLPYLGLGYSSVRPSRAPVLVFCGHRSVKEIERYDFAKGPAAKITASRVNDHEFGCVGIGHLEERKR